MLIRKAFKFSSTRSKTTSLKLLKIDINSESNKTQGGPLQSDSYVQLFEDSTLIGQLARETSAGLISQR